MSGGELLAACAAPLAAAQACLMAADEFVWHARRGLGAVERWSHLADALAFAAALAPAALLPPGPRALLLYAALAVFSTLLITKDEWLHADACAPGEHWSHAVLFALHPAVLIAVGALWTRGEGALLRTALPLAALGWGLWRFRAWRADPDASPEPVDNSFYEGLGARWHDDDAHAVALLRAESPVRADFVRRALSAAGLARGARVLDAGCGGGFLSNPLAAAGFAVKGVDLSAGSLDAARSHAPAGARVEYAVGDALVLDEPDASYDAVLLMDILEHLEEPGRAVAEAARVLKPGGLLFFHTFNRTPAAWLLAVKGIAFVARDTPAHVHAYRLFLTPAELKDLGERAGLDLRELRGIRPRLGRPFFSSLLRRRVHPDFSFTLTRSTAVGYLGVFVKR